MGLDSFDWFKSGNDWQRVRLGRLDTWAKLYDVFKVTPSPHPGHPPLTVAEIKRELKPLPMPKPPYSIQVFTQNSGPSGPIMVQDLSRAMYQAFPPVFLTRLVEGARATVVRNPADINAYHHHQRECVAFICHKLAQCHPRVRSVLPISIDKNFKRDYNPGSSTVAYMNHIGHYAALITTLDGTSLVLPIAPRLLGFHPFYVRNSWHQHWTWFNIGMEKMAILNGVELKRRAEIVCGKFKGFPILYTPDVNVFHFRYERYNGGVHRSEPRNYSHLWMLELDLKSEAKHAGIRVHKECLPELVASTVDGTEFFSELQPLINRALSVCPIADFSTKLPDTSFQHVSIDSFNLLPNPSIPKLAPAFSLLACEFNAALQSHFNDPISLQICDAFPFSVSREPVGFDWQQQCAHSLVGDWDLKRTFRNMSFVDGHLTCSLFLCCHLPLAANSFFCEIHQERIMWFARRYSKQVADRDNILNQEFQGSLVSSVDPTLHRLPHITPSLQYGTSEREEQSLRRLKKAYEENSNTT